MLLSDLYWAVLSGLSGTLGFFTLVIYANAKYGKRSTINKLTLLPLKLIGIFYATNIIIDYGSVFMPYARRHEEKQSIPLKICIQILYNIGSCCQVIACVTQLFEWNLVWMMVQFQHRDELDTEVIVNRAAFHTREKKLMALYIFLAIVYCVF